MNDIVRMLSDRIVDCYNRADYSSLSNYASPDLHFSHYNRNFTSTNLNDLLGTMSHFSAEIAPDRRFEPPETVIVQGSVVVREAFFVGTATIDVPGFADSGQPFRIRLCSMMWFDGTGMLKRWSDYG